MISLIIFSNTHLASALEVVRLQYHIDREVPGVHRAYSLERSSRHELLIHVVNDRLKWSLLLYINMDVSVDLDANIPTTRHHP